VCSTEFVRIIRPLLSLLIVAGSAVAVSRVSAQDVAPLAVAPCDAAAIGAAFTNGLRLSSLTQFACENGWAYAWANIGTGPTEVSVTEVLRFDAVTGVWKFALRHDVCKLAILPSEIYQKGCFSN